MNGQENSEVEYKRNSEQGTTMSRRTYLQGLGTTSMIAGLAVSGARPTAASTTSQSGYGEGGYGELGYGGTNDDRAGSVELVICVESAEGEPVEDAEITIQDEPVKTAQTNSDGQVTVKLTEGDYSIEASKDGYYREAVVDLGTANGNQISYLMVLEM